MTPGGRRSRAVLVVLAMVLYVTVSRALGEQYPFGPLSMFSEGLRVSSRIIARAPDGRFCELSSFERWQCKGDLDFSAAANPQCKLGAEHVEQDRKAVSLLRASAGGASRDATSRDGASRDGASGNAASQGTSGAKVDGAGVPVTVVRRAFATPRPGGPVIVEECDLVECTAVEIPGTCASTR